MLNLSIGMSVWHAGDKHQHTRGLTILADDASTILNNGLQGTSAQPVFVRKQHFEQYRTLPCFLPTPFDLRANILLYQNGDNIDVSHPATFKPRTW
jgi:hypothetical protein